MNKIAFKFVAGAIVLFLILLLVRENRYRFLPAEHIQIHQIDQTGRVAEYRLANDGQVDYLVYTSHQAQCSLAFVELTPAGKPLTIISQTEKFLPICFDVSGNRLFVVIFEFDSWQTRLIGFDLVTNNVILDEVISIDDQYPVMIGSASIDKDYFIAVLDKSYTDYVGRSLESNRSIVILDVSTLTTISDGIEIDRFNIAFGAGFKSEMSISHFQGGLEIIGVDIEANCLVKYESTIDLNGNIDSVSKEQLKQFPAGYMLNLNENGCAALVFEDSLQVVDQANHNVTSLLGPNKIKGISSMNRISVRKMNSGNYRVLTSDNGKVLTLTIDSTGHTLSRTRLPANSTESWLGAKEIEPLEFRDAFIFMDPISGSNLSLYEFR